MSTDRIIHLSFFTKSVNIIMALSPNQCRINDSPAVHSKTRVTTIIKQAAMLTMMIMMMIITTTIMTVVVVVAAVAVAVAVTVTVMTAMEMITVINISMIIHHKTSYITYRNTGSLILEI